MLFLSSLISLGYERSLIAFLLSHCVFPGASCSCFLSSSMRVVMFKLFSITFRCTCCDLNDAELIDVRLLFNGPSQEIVN